MTVSPTATLNRPLVNATATPCQNADPELWFSEHPNDMLEARGLCLAECPLATFNVCKAQGQGEEWGVWGGEGPVDRRSRLAREQREAREARNAEIVRRYDAGELRSHIALSVGVSRRTVTDVLHDAHMA